MIRSVNVLSLMQDAPPEAQRFRNVVADTFALALPKAHAEVAGLTPTPKVSTCCHAHLRSISLGCVVWSVLMANDARVGWDSAGATSLFGAQQDSAEVRGYVLCQGLGLDQKTEFQRDWSCKSQSELSQPKLDRLIRQTRIQFAGTVQACAG